MFRLRQRVAIGSQLGIAESDVAASDSERPKYFEGQCDGTYLPAYFRLRICPRAEQGKLKQQVL